MDFPEFYKKLEAKFWGAGAKLMGLQLELRLGKRPSRSFRPIKSAEILWQFWTSCSLRVSLAHDEFLGASFAIVECHLPIESIIASRSTDVMMAATQTTNNNSIRSILEKEKLNGSNFLDWYRNLRIVLRNEQKLHHLEEALPEAPPATATAAVRNAYTRRVAEQQEVACLMLQQAEQELFETVKAFHACKQEEGQSVSTYVLKMKAYLDQMERLGYPMPLVLGVNMILTSLSKDYDQFVQNYNMHDMGKTIPELHAMQKLAKKGIPKKTPAILAIRQCQIVKPKSQAQGKGKQRGKGKRKLAYDPKHKIPPPTKKEHPTKDTECIFTIELFSFPKSNSWIYDTGCSTHIWNTFQGLRGYRKLNKGALDLYVGNGNTATVQAIGSFDLILPSGMILVLSFGLLDVLCGVYVQYDTLSRLIKISYSLSFENQIMLPLHFTYASAIWPFSCSLCSDYDDVTPSDTYSVQAPSGGVTWGCEALVKRDTPNKLESRSIKCIFIGYPKETMGYYFYYPLENKIFVSRSARIPQAPERYGFYVDSEEQELGDHGEPLNYRAALLDPESKK
ncbi:hypothetical protein Tco_0697845 [Tanacetum coccineum]